MPYAYSPTYYEDQKKEHDFYINLGNQCRVAEEQRRIAEEKRQAWRKAQLEAQMLQEYIDKAKRVLDKSKRVMETNRKLSHALWEYNYTKDKELVLLPDRIAWRDCLPLD